jgi:hypothetical protein
MHQPVLGIPQPLLQLVDHVASVAARLPAVHGMLQCCGSTTLHLLIACKQAEGQADADGHLRSKHCDTQLAMQCSLRTCFSFGTTENLAVVALMMAISTACRGMKHKASAPQVSTCLSCQIRMASLTLALLCACCKRLSEAVLHRVCCVTGSVNTLRCSGDLSLSTAKFLPASDPQVRFLPRARSVCRSATAAAHTSAFLRHSELENSRCFADVDHSKASRDLADQPPSNVSTVLCVSVMPLAGEWQVPSGTGDKHDMCMTGAQNTETTSSDGAHSRRTTTACCASCFRLAVRPHKPCRPFVTSADPQRQSGVIASQAEQE